MGLTGEQHLRVGPLLAVAALLKAEAVAVGALVEQLVRELSAVSAVHAQAVECRRRRVVAVQRAAIV